MKSVRRSVMNLERKGQLDFPLLFLVFSPGDDGGEVSARLHIDMEGIVGKPWEAGDIEMIGWEVRHGEMEKISMLFDIRANL